MGVIKDGTVSGVLPSAEAFAIHYPGYPSTVSRAIETLGGINGLGKARSSDSQTVELHFRPEDPYSHPVIGRLQGCNNFLLRLSKTRSCNKNYIDDSSSRVTSSNPVQSYEKVSCPDSVNGAQLESQGEMAPKDQEARHEESEASICADIVAKVSESYCFDGMADYQHVLPVHADAARRKKRQWSDMEPQFQKSGTIVMDDDDVLMLIPPFFSVKDIPEQVVLRPSSTGSHSKKKQDDSIQYLTGKESTEIQDRIFFVDYSVQDIPKEMQWEKYIPRASDLWKCQMAVCKMFDERPIWPKRSVDDRLCDEKFKIENNVLRRLLFHVAYYFSNGPFQRFWIRRGYDPRKDPGSCVYQRIDYRVAPSLRGYCDDRPQAKQNWRDLYSFKCFPVKCHVSLQFFELEDEYIQQEIRKPVKQSTCNRVTGWFSAPVHESLKLRVSIRFLSVYPELGAEKMLRTYTKMFEKSKRRIIFDPDSRIDKSVEQAQKEILPSQGENEEAGDDVVEKEPDDYEDEYEEPLDMSADDAEIPFLPSSYTNISTDYLRNIFDTFPSAEPGSCRVPDTNASDGEYQIYEPYSDGNDSDDD